MVSLQYSAESCPNRCSKIKSFQSRCKAFSPRSKSYQTLQIHLWQCTGNTRQDFCWRKNHIISNAFMERMCSLSTPQRPRKRGRAMYLREWNVWLNDRWRSEMVRIPSVHVRDAILYSAKDVWLLYVNCSIQFSACLNRETLILTIWQTSVLFVKSITSDPVETVIVRRGKEKGLKTSN